MTMFQVIENYKKSLMNTSLSDSDTINPQKLKLDLLGIIKYAREKGVRVCDLSEEEKKLFLNN